MPARAARTSIPDKLFFKIGEVAKIVGVEPYVLRYWETEFPLIRPSKTRSKHRLYRRRDVDALLEIKRLLHKERFTIEGARKHLRALKARRKSDAPSPPRPTGQGTQLALPLAERPYRNALGRVKKELEALYRLLGGDA